MKRYWFLALAAGVLIAFGFTGVSTSALADTETASTQLAESPPCLTKSFQTDLIKAACKAGGQKAAKKAMMKWVKKVKTKKRETDPEFKLSCKKCHQKKELPDGSKWKYDRKAGSVERFKELDALLK